jgi:hypothetical protein
MMLWILCMIVRRTQEKLCDVCVCGSGGLNDALDLVHFL